MILRAVVLMLAIFAFASLVQASPRDLTVFSDGILVELDATAKKGVAEVAIPGLIREGTLRVKPLDNAVIGTVELLPAKPSDRFQKEMDTLAEQKSRLLDRMKALEHREGIFAAAAKSQSSKAPRKSKTNPDPLASVRQGTDFAIAQLEAVYTARRKIENELKRIDARILSLSGRSNAGNTARVKVSPANGRLRIAAVLQNSGWIPRYEIRMHGDSLFQLVMLAEIKGLPEGFSVSVAPAALAAGVSQQLLTLPASGAPRLASWQLSVEKGQIFNGVLPSYNITFKNSTGISLPAGQAAIYSNGEYLGTAEFPATAIGLYATVKSNK